MHLTIILFFFLLSFPIKANGLLLSYGHSTSKDQSQVTKLGYVLEPSVDIAQSLGEGFSLEIEISTSEWENLYGPDIKVGSITPLLVYNTDFLSYPSFVRFGIGLAYINQTQWGNRSLGDNWIFEDKLELGFKLMKHHRIGMSLTHYSNGATNKNNDGTTLVSLNYRLHW